VLVPTEQVNEARMKLAAQGLPRANAEVGLEILDEQAAFTGSQFAENVRFKRGLEGELAKTISSMEAIKNARVHLGLPRESSFIGKKTVASASVMLELFQGRTLEQNQIMGIAHLVASSIPGLNKEDVTIVDQRGRLLSAMGAHSSTAAAMEQFNYIRQLEGLYSKRISEILTPILGVGKLHPEVTIDMDFKTTEETQETYNNEKPAIRNESLSREEKDADAISGGIPGALANQPQAAGVAPETTAAAVPPAPGQTKTSPTKIPSKQGNLRQQSTRNFELDRAIKHVKHSTGIVKKISVAVVVDDKVSYDKKGKETRTPLTDQELEKMTLLVKDTVGFNAERGDTVNIVNSSFAQAAPMEPMVEPSFWKQAWFASALKQTLAGGFLLTIILVVLRPLMKGLAVLKPHQMQSIQPDVMENDTLELSAPIKKASAPSAITDTHIEQVKQLVHNDSKKVASLVMNWVGAEHE
jgi:flagellar M-ring protein FliF